MLVIKDLFDGSEINKKKKTHLKNKHKATQSFIRYTDYIDNKPFYIIEVNKSHLYSDKIQKILSAYKGRVVINENLTKEPFGEYLFDSTNYCLRALLSSLLNRINYEKNTESICIKYDEILICKEMFELVKNVRNVHCIVNSDIKTVQFKNECFKRYGTFIKTSEYSCTDEFDVYIDLSQMTSDCKCEVYFKGKRGLLYPDCTFFEADDNVKKLLKYGVDKKIACSICEVKRT